LNSEFYYLARKIFVKTRVAAMKITREIF